MRVTARTLPEANQALILGRYQFAQAVMIAAGLDPDRVTPISTADLTPRRPAPRPANSILENAALMNASIDLLPDFREPLNRLIKELEIT